MKLLGATASHVGNVREANQDRVFFRGQVAALADGMGGHQGGERAAELAITEFREAGQELSEGDLVEVVLQANRQVHGHAADNGLPGMGTTVVAMTLHDDNTITVANVGDSRAYWLRGDYMGQVTEDHSFVEDLVRQGRLTPQEAANHPQRNILTRAVGIGAEVEVDRFPIPEPEIGDRFLLCSDGLFNELTEDDILEILLGAGDPADTATALIEATLQTPCRDNVTVAVVEVVADDDPRLASQDDDRQAEESPGSDKVVTAPVPVVSKSVLHDPPPDGVASGPGSGGDGEGRTSNTAGSNGSGPAAAAASSGTLLLAEAAARSGSDDVDVVDDPELYLETAEMEIVDDIEPMSVRPRSRLLLALGALLVVAGLAAAGFFGARAYASSSYFIAEASSGNLAIYEGRRGGFLGFEPVDVVGTELAVDALDETEQAMVAEDFSSRAEAEAVIEKIEMRHAEAAAQALLDEGEGSTAASDSSQSTDSSQVGNSQSNPSSTSVGRSTTSGSSSSSEG